MPCCILPIIVICCVTPSAAQERWTLATNPEFTLGSAEGSVTTSFHDVRGALRGSGGEIIVADGGSFEIRVFAPSDGPMSAAIPGTSAPTAWMWMWASSIRVGVTFAGSADSRGRRGIDTEGPTNPGLSAGRRWHDPLKTGCISRRATPSK